MQATLEEMSARLKAVTGPGHFAECVGSTFRVEWNEGDAVDLELVSATSLGPLVARGSLKREPFSLIFRADSPQFYRPQKTCRVEHAKLDPLDIFLVPIGPDEKGMRFQAIFN